MSRTRSTSRLRRAAAILTIIASAMTWVVVSQTAASAATCREQTRYWQLKHKNGEVIARYNTRIRWCYDGRVVTSAVDTEWPSVTGFGRLLGYRFDARLVHREGFYTYNGRTRGGWVSRSYFRFQICPVYMTWCVMSKTGYTNFYVHYDGTSHHSVAAF